MELVAKIENAIVEGLKVRGDGRPRGGCGRAYVAIGKVERPVLNAVKKAAERAGVRYLKEAYGVCGKNVQYVGYDNATGVQLAQAEAIAKNLRGVGINAYDEGVGD